MTKKSFPKAILHIDGDAFFASCELTKRPWLRGKPVVTGLEKGIASSMTYEAKARGITRAMRISEMRRVCPELIILPSDYLLYSTYATRMYSIVRRYTDIVEEYSIDECFADITGMDKVHKMSYVDIARCIKEDLETELGITFSVGLSVNKVLSKLASKWQKPRGFTVISSQNIPEYTKSTPIGKLWGIGKMTSIDVGMRGLKTAHDLASKPIDWVSTYFDKPLQEMHAELNGFFVHRLESDRHSDQSSIQRTRTFYPPSTDRTFILSQLSQHIENTCARMREMGVFASKFSIFIKTQDDFRRYSTDFRLVHPSSSPTDFIKIVEKSFDNIFVKGVKYRASGVCMFGLSDTKQESLDLFCEKGREESNDAVFKVVDNITKKFGTDTIYLASSTHKKVKITKTKKRFRIPVLGVVR